MDHERADELLSEYLDGSLDADRTAALERHLADCPECRRSLTLLRRTLRVVERLPQVRAPERFARRVEHRARRAGLLRGRRRRLSDRMSAPFSSIWTTWALLLSVGLLLVVVLIAQQQIDVLLGSGPVRVALADAEQRQAVVAVAERLELAVEADAGPAGEVELRLRPERWAELRAALAAAGLDLDLPIQPPRPGPGGRVRLWLGIGPVQPAGRER
jgi:anti-sigma factor RsiW